MILDNSEESIIILNNKKINYVNKKFLNKYKSVIMKFEEVKDDVFHIIEEDEVEEKPKTLR
jgi:hypothetical protein